MRRSSSGFGPWDTSTDPMDLPRLAPAALAIAIALAACGVAAAQGTPDAATGSQGADAGLAARVDVGERLARRLALAPGDTIEVRAGPTRPGGRLVVNAIVPDAA